MSVLTLGYLKDNNFFDTEIKFFIRNKLLGFPLDRLNEIKGGSGEIEYLKNINNIYEDVVNETVREYSLFEKEFDANGNVVFEKSKYGEISFKYDDHGNVTYRMDIAYPNIHEYVWEYYHDGQLKSGNGIIFIPWFKKNNLLSSWFEENYQQFTKKYFI